MKHCFSFPKNVVWALTIHKKTHEIEIKHENAINQKRKKNKFLLKRQKNNAAHKNKRQSTTCRHKERRDNRALWFALVCFVFLFFLSPSPLSIDERREKRFEISTRADEQQQENEQRLKVE